MYTAYMKQRKQITLSDDGAELLDSLAQRLGIARSSVLELALRKYATGEGLPLPEPKPAPARKQARPKAGQ